MTFESLLLETVLICVGILTSTEEVPGFPPKDISNVRIIGIAFTSPILATCVFLTFILPPVTSELLWIPTTIGAQLAHVCWCPRLLQDLQPLSEMMDSRAQKAYLKSLDRSYMAYQSEFRLYRGHFE